MRAGHLAYRTTPVKAVVLGLLAAAALAGLLVLSTLGHFRMAFAATILLFLLAVAFYKVELGVICAVVYLIILGELRRLLILMDGWPDFDPLLLIGSGFAAVVLVSLLARKQIDAGTPLSKAVFLLMLVMILQMFNPAQGGLVVGMAGAMFYLVPLFWFWLGRHGLTERSFETLLFKVILPFGLVATLFSLYQTFNGYLPHQQMWYDLAGYGSLGPAFALKPLTFFSSSTENAVFLSIAVIILLCFAIRGQALALVPAAVAIVAIFLIGSRGPIVKIVFAAACLWAVLGRTKASWVARSGLALVIGVVGLIWTMNQVSKIEAEGAAGFYLERQTTGILGSLEEGSSAHGHSSMFFMGIRRGFQTPLGTGLGSTTKAAGKYGVSGGSTEMDLSNIFVSTGVVGGLIYLFIIVMVFVSAVKVWERDRTTVAMVMLGVLLISVMTWLHGGRYCLAPLLWLVIGRLDGMVSKPSLPQPTLSRSIGRDD